MTTKEEAVKSNYNAFKLKLPDLIPQHAGKFALLREGEIVAVFDTARDALVAGEKIFEDELYSVQEVTTTPVNLGFWSYA